MASNTINGARPATVDAALTAAVEKQKAREVDQEKTERSEKNAKAKLQGTYDLQLSPEGKERSAASQKAMDIAMATPDIRMDRVEQIKAQIAAGTYKADAGKIADGMMREAIKEHLAVID